MSWLFLFAALVSASLTILLKASGPEGIVATFLELRRGA
jgi:hypothetical protein